MIKSIFHRAFYGFILISIGVLFLFNGSAQSAAAQKVKLSLSSNLSPGSCLELAADKFKEIVEKKSNGNITVIRYPSGELYDSKSEVEAIVNGSVDMALMHVAYVGARSPALEFISSFGVQGCWLDNDHFYRFLDMPEVQEIANKEFAGKLNAKLLSPISYGTGVVGTNKKAVHTIADFKNLKMRASGTAQAIMYKALGAIPVELSVKEVFMALQRGTIDGACSGPGRFYFSKWYETTPYIVHDYSIPYLQFWHTMNMNKWKKLTPENHKIVADAAREIALWARDYVVKETELIYQKFKDGLIKEMIFLSNEERTKLNNVVSPVMHDFTIKRCGKDMGEKLWGYMIQAQNK
ncbi:TRAP transporter substrate-binding protein [Desulfobacula toluolica]|uniref:DctP2: TRAP dicarboxylate transporter periplasmic binding protein n=1 Tax=Desulfobacula toluolica (strain DSM 7467 / Tol2) TaxID=651182 RepID=K0N2G3_DESTT|nr:TRAP transporter substrate-binding protein [Desulfobacula toluolica]CCK78329.1 DctP2: TRAP dicarboxylate transporter periplasmic binding protein [Desulfobacula toluolica Tol2]